MTVSVSSLDDGDATVLSVTAERFWSPVLDRVRARWTVSPGTRAAAETLRRLAAVPVAPTATFTVPEATVSLALVVDVKDNEHLHLAVRNLSKFDVLAPEGLNLESVLRRKSLVLTQSAAKALEGTL